MHSVIGAEYMTTVIGSSASHICQAVLFAIVISIVCWAASLPRTFSMLSHYATIAALFTFVSVTLVAVFLGMQGRPAQFKPGQLKTGPDGHLQPVGRLVFSPWPAPGADFVSLMVAVLNICYTFIGQTALPSFIAEMKDPRYVLRQKMFRH